ncbi:MAG TPA: PorV/PorQ family protein [Candidatus Eisenbacteria bacterium]|nr:PorV/PorQ family protein [Candidatus Eisenbacteria bacterium]
MREPMERFRSNGVRRLRLLAIGLALASCLAAQPARAADERVGTGGALELRLPVGPRGSALGAPVVADVNNIEATFWNPAGLGAIEHPEALFTHTNYIADMNLNFAAVALRLGGFGTLGLHAKVLDLGDVIETTEDAPEGTGVIINPTFTTLGVSWGRQFTDRVLFGATVNYVDENILNTSARGVAFDLGVQYITGWRGLRFGVAMKNVGPAMHFTGSDFNESFRPPDSDPTSRTRVFSTSSANFELPSFFSLAATYDVWAENANRLALLGAFQNNNFVGNTFNGGLEYSYRDQFAVRGSYFGSVQSQTDFNTGASSSSLKAGDDLYEGLALGAGVKLPLGGTRLGLDATWRAVRNFFDDTLEIGARVDF